MNRNALKRKFGGFVKAVFFFLFLSSVLYGNQPEQEHNLRFDRISIEENLSQSSVRAVLQDSRGFLWFGTEDGLNKYDGYSFTVYGPDPDNPYSFSSSFVRTIVEDHEGFLWIGTNGGGLNKFDRSTERFYHYLADHEDEHSISSNIVRTAYEDSFGELWIGTEGGGLDRYERDTEQFIHYRAEADNPYSLSHDVVLAICEDRSGNLWIGTYGGGLNKFDRDSGRFCQYRALTFNPYSLSNDRVLAICEDRYGYIWVGTDGGGLNRFDPETGRFEHYFHDPDNSASLSSSVVRSVYEDQFGVLWIGTEGGGLDKYDRKTGKFLNYQYESDNPESLSNNIVHSIYEDRSGILWIGTDAGGVCKLNRSKVKFAIFQNDPSDSNSLNNSQVWCIFQDRKEPNILWIGTRNGGLNKFDRESNKFTHYTHNPEDPDSISGNFVRTIYQDRSGTLWIGTHYSGLNRFDPVSGKFTRYQHDPDNPDSLGNNRVYTILEDHEGVLWIGTRSGGLNRLDRESGKFERFLHDPEDPGSLSNDFVYKLYQDESNRLWIGTFGGGLDKFNRATETFSHYQSDSGNLESISSDFVLTIYQDLSGVLWIGTGGSGLNKFDPARGTFKHYLEKDGLVNNMVYGILEDERGNLWISTNRGISKFNPETEKFKTYDVRDGLQSDEFNGGAFFGGVRKYCDEKRQEGVAEERVEMFFGGINGFNAFFPSEIKDNPHEPAVVITKLLLFNEQVPIGESDGGRVILEKSITETDKIVLAHEQNYISLEFAALDFTIPEKNQYAYMLEGYDKDWIYTYSGMRFTSYKRLPPGEYKFRVRASNNDGVWNDAGASLTIIIIPPFWETWWFQTIGLLAVITVIAVIYSVSTKRIRERNIRKERAAREMEIARDIQRSMLPSSPPALEGAEVALTTVSAKHVEGDFYTFFEYGPRRLGLVVGDIVGKGVPGALTMAATVSSLRVIIPRSDTVTDTMSWLNNHLVENTVKRSFAAVLFAVIDLEDMTMRWCNAGLPEPVLLSPGKEPRFLEMPRYSLPPGVSIRSRYIEETAPLNSGDKLVFLTDGFIEARSAEGADEVFGFRRLLDFLGECADKDPQGIIDSLVAELSRFQGKDTLEDDVTVVVVEIK